MKNVALHNLGCKVNSYEIEVMQQKLQEKGYNIVPFDTVADIYIVNTCTVTNMADRKSRQMLHRAKQMNPEAVVVAVGCYVQTGREKAEADDSIDLLIGNNRKKDIVNILEDYLLRREAKTDNCVAIKSNTDKTVSVMSADMAVEDKTLDGTSVLDINHTYEYEEMQLKQTAERTRATIKIQDGCNQFCSYCAIPLARGRVRSRRKEDVLQEIQTLVAVGFREVVLTGIHLSSYGIDFDNQRAVYTGQETNLIDLLEEIHEIEGLERIRIGSLEPRIVTPQTAKRMAALRKLCPHFHLSLQSGCDATLKRMNRRYTAQEYFDAVQALREVFEQPAITTDVIVGFPGETEEEFAQTKEFLEKIGFYEMHIFKYSKREGTVAAKMKEQVPEQIKTVRSNELLELEKLQSKKFRKKYIGQEAEVLLEDVACIQGKEWRIGHTKDYVKIAVPAEGTEANCLIKVKVTDFLTDEVMC